MNDEICFSETKKCLFLSKDNFMKCKTKKSEKKCLKKYKKQSRKCQKTNDRETKNFQICLKTIQKLLKQKYVHRDIIPLMFNKSQNTVLTQKSKLDYRKHMDLLLSIVKLMPTTRINMFIKFIETNSGLNFKRIEDSKEPNKILFYIVYLLKLNKHICRDSFVKKDASVKELLSLCRKPNLNHTQKVLLRMNEDDSIFLIDSYNEKIVHMIPGIKCSKIKTKGDSIIKALSDYEYIKIKSNLKTDYCRYVSMYFTLLYLNNYESFSKKPLPLTISEEQIELKKKRETQRQREKMERSNIGRNYFKEGRLNLASVMKTFTQK